MKPDRPRKRRATTAARPRRHLPEITRYVVAIEGWDWSLSFGVNDVPKEAAPFNDYRHLQIRGTLVRPSNINARAVELTLIPDTRLGRNDWTDGTPAAVGSLNLNLNLERLLQGLLTLPADALAPVVTVLTAGRLKYVVLDGEPLRHRRALIRRYRLEMSYEDEELPPTL
jgi:hypothetical protein